VGLSCQIEATTAETKTKNQIQNMNTIQIQDPADKNNTFIFSKTMAPLGIVHCIAPCEWEAIDANGQHIELFTSKKAALASLA
jgi:hypothetical protein